MYNLTNLTEVLQKVIHKNEEEILKIDSKPLTAPGENYGSIILSVDVRIRKKDNSERNLLCVVKLIPENEFIRGMFNINQTFNNEIHFYSTTIPILQNFQKKHKAKIADYFPKFYGAKVDYDGENIKDSSLLVLEHMKEENFVVENRFVGFDLDSAKLILEKLANLHGTSIAFKTQNPDVFEEKIRPYLDGIDMAKNLSQDVFDKNKKDCEKVLGERQDCVYLIDRIQNMFTIDGSLIKRVRKPFEAITHSDFWVNNIMLKWNEGTPTAVRLLDFQTVEYGSPAKDILLFLFTSVRNDVVCEYTDLLIDFYYEKLINTLKELNSDTTQFSFEAFQEDLKMKFKEWLFLHITGMWYPIFKHKVEAQELKDFTAESLLKDEELSQEHKEKIWRIFPVFVKKGWM